MFKKVVGKTKLKFVIMCIMCFVKCIFEMVILVEITKYILNDLLDGKRGGLGKLCILFASASIIYIIAVLIGSFYQFVIKRNTVKQLEDEAINHLFCLDNWQLNYNSGEILAKIRTDIPKAVGGYVLIIWSLLEMIINIICGSTYAILLNWKVYIVCLFVVLVSYVITYKSYKKMPGIEKRAGDLFNRNYSNVWEVVANSEVVPFLNSTNVLHDFESTASENVKNAVEKGRSYANVNISKKIINVGLVLVVAVSGAFFSYGSSNLSMEISELMALIVVIPKTASALLLSYDWSVQRKEFDGVYKRLTEFFSLKEYISDGKCKVPEKIEKITLNNLHYGYGEEKVLKNINCCFETGNMYYITGKSGCGKSTLLKVLMSLLPVRRGMVYIGDVDLVKIDREELWKSISYVDQNPHIISGNMQENITTNNAFDMKKMEYVVECATMNRTFGKVEEFRYKVIDESKLSSGEKQKICLARALYQNRKVLLLDEATAAMDPLSQTEVYHNLVKHCQMFGTIVLVVNHNSTIMPEEAICLTIREGKVC